MSCSIASSSYSTALSSASIYTLDLYAFSLVCFSDQTIALFNLLDEALTFFKMSVKIPTSQSLNSVLASTLTLVSVPDSAAALFAAIAFFFALDVTLDSGSTFSLASAESLAISDFYLALASAHALDLPTVSASIFNLASLAFLVFSAFSLI